MTATWVLKSLRKAGHPRRYVELGDGAGHGEQVEAEQGHETENEAQDEERLSS